MAVVKTILTVVFIIISVALTVIILMQESKSAGLGAIAGAADTYWGKNKGRSMEGMLAPLKKSYRNFLHLPGMMCWQGIILQVLI